jgi:hypothetical protein
MKHHQPPVGLQATFHQIVWILLEVMKALE